MKLLLYILCAVEGQIVSDIIQVVTRVPKNPSIQADDNNGKHTGFLNMLVGKLRMQREDRVASNGKVKVQPWSEDSAKYYFPVAGLTYCSDQQLLNFNGTYSKEIGPEFQITNILNHATLDTRAIVAVNPPRKEIVLAFRGTQSKLNWAEDFAFKHTAMAVASQASVHTGFKDIADAMAPEFIQAIRQLVAMSAYREYSVVVTGHSLGGAVAHIASIQVHQDLKIGWERIKIVTFGQPRVGNIEFARWFNQQPVMYTRVVNENDPVPHGPPIATGYIHTHLERYIQNNKSRICNTDLMEDPSCSASRLLTLNPSAHSYAWNMKNSNTNC
ncbi:hypothetical protein DSO57_1014476 [Entomophthora muscae]|uniref:Uncharacterized protein n=1 Tax=Entomophthora muscae TaxID=34485 RepID=A0ACC2TT53_9FUNG|nr:hypothetical protein DSO57_1014476 [Entomophthora muscae]